MSTLPDLKFSDLKNHSQIRQTNDAAVKPAKVTLLYVDRVNNIQPLLKMLDEVAADNFEVKVLNFEVKVRKTTKLEYNKVRIQERCFNLVLKNLHLSIDTEEIKAELEMQGHKVYNI